MSSYVKLTKSKPSKNDQIPNMESDVNYTLLFALNKRCSAIEWYFVYENRFQESHTKIDKSVISSMVTDPW